MDFGFVNKLIPKYFPSLVFNFIYPQLWKHCEKRFVTN